MRDQLLTISGTAALELIALGLDGQMTEATYMELLNSLCHSLLNAKTIEGTTSPAGSANSTPRLATQEEFLGASSTSGRESLAHLINTRLSHSQCWCNSSGKPDTNE